MQGPPGSHQQLNERVVESAVACFMGYVSGAGFSSELNHHIASLRRLDRTGALIDSLDGLWSQLQDHAGGPGTVLANEYVARFTGISRPERILRALGGVAPEDLTSLWPPAAAIALYMLVASSPFLGDLASATSPQDLLRRASIEPPAVGPPPGQADAGRVAALVASLCDMHPAQIRSLLGPVLSDDDSARIAAADSAVVQRVIRLLHAEGASKIAAHA
jgi:hypothetical protein